VLDRLKYALVNLSHSEQGVFVQTLPSKHCVDILTKVEPLDPLLSGYRAIDVVDFMNLVELVFGQYETQSGHDSLKLIACDNILSKSVKIQEELLYSDPF
jgi:hypothetical protein